MDYMKARRVAREKLSTTVSVETYRFLVQKVESGEVATIAEALDLLIDRIRQLENRERLSSATSRYFNEMLPRAAAEENALSKDLALAATGIDFDKEL